MSNNKNEDVLVENMEELAAQLKAAVKDGQIENVRDLIKCGVSPNAISLREKECQGLSPLHIAVRHDHVDCVEVLLSNGADVNIEDNFGFRPIHDACLLGHTSCLRELLRKNASIDGVSRVGLQHVTPLLYAAQQHHLDCTVMVKARTQGAEKTLWDAVAKRGNTRMLELVNDADDLQEDDMATMVRHSALNGNLSFLIHACREVGIPEDSAEQALLIASQHGRESITRFLIEQGLNANIANERGLTALHYAARYGHLELIDDLLRMGAIIDAVAEDNITPLHLAVRQCQSEAVGKLIDLGADRNMTGGDRLDTPLHMAIKIGDIPTLQEILRREPEFTVKNADGKTPLQISAPKDVKDILMQYFRN